MKNNKNEEQKNKIGTTNDTAKRKKINDEREEQNFTSNLTGESDDERTVAGDDLTSEDQGVDTRPFGESTFEAPNGQLRSSQEDGSDSSDDAQSQDPDDVDGLGDVEMGSDDLSMNEETAEFKDDESGRFSDETSGEDSSKLPGTNQSPEPVDTALMNMFKQYNVSYDEVKKEVSKFIEANGFNLTSGAKTLVDSNAAAYKFAETIKDVQASGIREQYTDELRRADLRAANPNPFTQSFDDFIVRAFDQFPMTWEAKLRKFNEYINHYKNNTDIFGRKLERHITSTATGLQGINVMMTRYLYSLIQLPFALPIIDMNSSDVADMRESSRVNLRMMRTWNIDKYRNYIGFIRDQVSLLPSANNEFKSALKSSTFVDFLTRDLNINFKSGTTPTDGIEPANDAQSMALFETYLWKGFNRALINTVITPSIRSLAVGSETGMMKLSNFKPLEAARMYAGFNVLLKRAVPTTFITKRLTEFIRKHHTWISDAQIYTEICSNSVSQSGPFVFEMLAEAIDDKELLSMFSIENNKDMDTDRVVMHVADLKIERKVKIRNIYNEPIVIEDELSYDKPVHFNTEITSKDVARLIAFYAYLKGVDFMTDLSTSSLSRYLVLSGMVASRNFTSFDIEQRPIWTILEKLTFIQFLSDRSAMRSVSDNLAPLLGNAGASLQSMSDYATNVMASCHASAVKVVSDVLVLLKQSREFHDLAIWDAIKEWGLDINIPDSLENPTFQPVTVDKNVRYAPSMAFIDSGTMKFTSYAIDKRLTNMPSIVTPEFKYFVKMLTDLQIKGEYESEFYYINRFQSTFSHEIDALSLLSAGVPKGLTNSVFSDARIHSTDELRFRNLDLQKDREITNLSFFSPVEDAARKNPDKFTIWRSGKDEIDDDKKLFNYRSYCLISEVDPMIYARIRCADDEMKFDEVPLNFILDSPRTGKTDGESLDKIYGLDWRDTEDEKLLRAVDLMNFVLIENESITSAPTLDRIMIPTSVDYLRNYVYGFDYDSTKMAEDSGSTNQQRVDTTHSQQEGNGSVNVNERSSDKTKEGQDQPDNQTQAPNNQKGSESGSESKWMKFLS